MPLAPAHTNGHMLSLNNVGGELAGLREQRGLGQSELARQAGVAQSSLSLIESGQRIPSFPTLVRLAKILNASICLCDLTP